MTDPEPITVPRPRRTERAVWILYAALVVAILVAAWALYDAHDANNHADSLGKIATANSQGLAKANSRLTDLGAQPVPTPSPGAAGPTGERGANGLAGRGIVGSQIRSGHLVLAYSDGTSLDVGSVIGPRGPKGATGSPGASGASGAKGSDGSNGVDGRSITSTTIDSDGHLLVSYSDGTSSDLGDVVGPAGASGSNGKDGTDGTDGSDGTDGYPPASFTFTVPGLTGDTQYLCTPDGAASAGSQPQYSCAEQPSSAPSGSSTP